MKSYDHWNFSTASVLQFRASRYIMYPNRISQSKVSTIWTFRQLPLFNFERRDILCNLIENPSEKLWPFEFLESFRSWISSVSIYYAPDSDIRVKSYDHLNFSRASIVQFRASRYIMSLNRICELKVMTIWISRELPWFNFQRLDMLWAWIELPSEKLWPFQFLESFCCSISSISIYYFPESDIRVKSYDNLNFSRASIFPFLESFRCSISSVSIWYGPESNIRVKSHDHFNCSRSFIVPFRASRYMMRLNLTSVWNFMMRTCSRARARIHL